MSGIFLMLRSIFYINLLKFLSFNIPVKRDSILDPSAYRFGKCAGHQAQKSSGVEIDGTVGISAQDTQTLKQIISNTVKVPISHHVESHSKWLC